MAVHPRACGERHGSAAASICKAGSSPRLRGTVQYPDLVTAVQGFIPAPAGNGSSASSPRATTTVHPRACGERLGPSCELEYSIGSSPRLRGTEGARAPFHAPSRFIPAPAGNGIRYVKLTACTPVHPRACGERLGRHLNYSFAFGSSPRLRGTAFRHGRSSIPRRFIPAPAGNGFPSPTRAASGSVHPRACGERFRTRTRTGCFIGSSPRLRGTGRSGRGGSHGRRFIPAPAGNGCSAYIVERL